MIVLDVINVLLADHDTGTLVDKRVYPLDMPQGAYLPNITVLEVSGGEMYAEDGPVGLNNSRVQIDCWAYTYTDAKNLASFVRVALTNSSVFLLAEAIDERDTRDEKADRSENPYHVILDLDIWERS